MTKRKSENRKTNIRSISSRFRTRGSSRRNLNFIERVRSCLFLVEKPTVLHIYIQNKTSLKVLTELSRYSCGNSKRGGKMILRLSKILTKDKILLIITIFGDV